MSGGLLAIITDPARHTMFWLFGPVFVVGVFLAVGGVLRRTMSVVDRGSRLIATAGVALLLGGAGGAVATAAGAPAGLTATMRHMVGAGSAGESAFAPAPPGLSVLDVTGVDFKFQ